MLYTISAEFVGVVALVLVLNLIGALLRYLYWIVARKEF